MYKKISAALLITFVLMYAGGLSAVSAEEETYPYSCGTSLGSDFDMNVTVTAEVPDSVTPGEEFTVNNFSTQVHLPEEVVGLLQTINAETVQGDLTKFNIMAENEDNIVNIAEDSSIPIPETDVPEEAGGFTLVVPGEGGLEAGSFIAGEKGETTIQVGGFDTELDVGLPGLPVTVNCDAPEEGIFATISIDEQDTEAPVITLSGDNPIELEVGENYEELGATAEDNVDGDLTEKVEVTGEVNTDEVGEYTLTYTVSDAAGNEATKTRTVNVVDPNEEVDTEAPVIMLYGARAIELEVGEAYEEPGVTAEDNVDGDLSDEVDVSGDVNTDEAGEYTITYTVTDTAGNTATATRTVKVVEPEEDPGKEEPKREEVSPGEEVDVSDMDIVQVERTNTLVYLPSGLSDNTELKITNASESDQATNADGFEVAGDVFTFEFSNSNLEDLSEPFELVMGYDPEKFDADEVDIYYYDEEAGEWVAQEGEVNAEDGLIWIKTSHFSTYGVLAQASDDEEVEEEEGTEESEETEGTDESDDSAGGELPDTATATPLMILIGSLMTAIGGGITLFRKKLFN